MAIHVYHNPDFLDCCLQPNLATVNLDRLYLVAIVATDSLEEAYGLTQHLDEEWYANSGVVTVIHSRSTSVGDVMAQPNGALWLVAPAGFRTLPGTIPVATGVVRTLQTAAEALVMAGAGDELITSLQGALQEIGYLYTALNFAVPVLDYFADHPNGTVHHDSYQSLLARFGREQARWALRAVRDSRQL